jgi:DNA repair protein RecO
MQIDAIILRRIPWREHDQLIVLYTRQLGKTAAMAKGSLQATSRQAPALDEGNHIRCRLVPGRSGMAVMTGAQAVRAWGTAKSEALRWASAQAVLQAVDAFCFDGQPDGGVWDALSVALGELDDRSSIPLRVLRTAQAGLLAALGHGLQPEPAVTAGRTALDDACERIAHLARHLRGVVE